MLMVIAPLMCLELVDPAVTLLAELTVERLAGFAGGLRLCRLSENKALRARLETRGGIKVKSQKKENLIICTTCG